MSTTKLTCHQCAAPLDSASLDRRLGIITCSHCDSIFDLAHTDLPIQNDDSLNKPIGHRAPAALPQGYSIKHQGDRLIIARSWRATNSLFSLLFKLIFPIIWLYILVIQSQAMTHFLDFSQETLFLIPFLLFGIFLLYKGLADLVNTTYIKADKTKLSINHSPLPWSPSPAFQNKDIEQIFITRQAHHTRDKNRNEEKIHYSYCVKVILRNNSSHILIKALTKIEQALFLEQEIESHLKIRDRKVAGEFKPDDAHH